ncbi:MAG: transcription termination factor Rho [candidate division KSB1 bacterium]|nr:transcription termination factor Rho [candidate division KSB1 bacterium]MDZ7273418.1 transcription termination factor Rho [candidate division KSB1 bacterium]MDZ7286989.1 transcription termination factor Rho [candidate division KSB1 bacterium]MDZ7299658.1 transcription termination factor Rho [candidate division KSB1 bacterium]MDZ7350765.1 transcription termination factor Rho [candidate division KSB1 bacterium]
MTVTGILEIEAKGFGFLRQIKNNLNRLPTDVFIPPPLIQAHRLLPGVELEVAAQQEKDGKLRAQSVQTIQGMPPEAWQALPRLEDLPAISPRKPLWLECEPAGYSQRLIDLFAPLGEGQRALIVAPPRSGKTMMLQQIAAALAHNHPHQQLYVLLLDERPEEVTEFRRSIRGQVFSSSYDDHLGNHLRLAKLVLEFVKRRTEAGGDVVLLIDSLTRTGRAFNAGQQGSGRLMTGGLDARALEVPKRIFGAARKIENAGSLTIIATILTDTGSRMDDFIFEEFKGTGNMELVLDRSLAEERLYPAINLRASSTRREELLFGEAGAAHQKLRRAISDLSPKDALQKLLKLLAMFPTNAALLQKFSQ